MLTADEVRHCTNYHRTDAELERFFLFCVFTAAKHAEQARRALNRFLGDASPFEELRRLRGQRQLFLRIKRSGIGQHYRIYHCCLDVLNAQPDLRQWHPEHFERLFGIGPKTSRFFLLHTRPDQPLAVLDTHLLAHLRSLGHAAPQRTPESPLAYARWEQVVLRLAHAEGLSPAAYDLKVWNQRASMAQEAA